MLNTSQLQQFLDKRAETVGLQLRVQEVTFPDRNTGKDVTIHRARLGEWIENRQGERRFLVGHAGKDVWSAANRNDLNKLLATVPGLDTVKVVEEKPYKAPSRKA